MRSVRVNRFDFRGTMIRLHVTRLVLVSLRVWLFPLLFTRGGGWFVFRSTMFHKFVPFMLVFSAVHWLDHRATEPFFLSSLFLPLLSAGVVIVIVVVVTVFIVVIVIVIVFSVVFCCYCCFALFCVVVCIDVSAE